MTDFKGRTAVITGANTGNLFIGHGLFHGLDCARKAFHPGFGAIPAERLHEHFDLVAIPASNFVGNGVDLTDAPLGQIGVLREPQDGAKLEA